MKTSTQHGLSGLDYVTILHFPIFTTPSGLEGLRSEDILACEELVSRRIVSSGIPLRGLEVRFLRKTFGLSFDKFAAPFGLTGAGVKKWEDDLTKRLSPVNEVAVRSWMSEKLGVFIEGKFSTLYGKSETPTEWIVDFSETREKVQTLLTASESGFSRASEISDLLNGIEELSMKADRLKRSLPASGGKKRRS